MCLHIAQDLQQVEQQQQQPGIPSQLQHAGQLPPQLPLHAVSLGTAERPMDQMNMLSLQAGPHMPSQDPFSSILGFQQPQEPHMQVQHILHSLSAGPQTLQRICCVSCIGTQHFSCVC
jgi:hypothetical protein